MIELKSVTGALLVACCCVVSAGAARADAGSTGEGLDACLAAALKERPGVLQGWKDVSTANDARYVISIVSNEGKLGDAPCSASAPGNLQFEERIGIRRLDSYSRIKVPEVSARSTAPQLFNGPVKVVKMEIDFNWKGQPAYEYRLILPTGREAVAQVDTASGELLHAEVLSQ